MLDVSGSDVHRMVEGSVYICVCVCIGMYVRILVCVCVCVCMCVCDCADPFSMSFYGLVCMYTCVTATERYPADLSCPNRTRS